MTTRLLRTYVYVDGFNVYYRALKGTGFRWLDVCLLAEHLLGPSHSVEKVRYYTAPVSGKQNRGTPHRQQIYLNALSSNPRIDIHLGSFISSVKVRELETPLADGTTHVRVLNSEEKGSDVNLATHLVHDAWSDHFDIALVLSQDTDLLEPIRLVQTDLRKAVGVVVLDGKAPGKLAKSASFMKQITHARLSAAQFARDVPYGKQGKVAHKPDTW
jgi:uncharacterized LabA/DUF88 family protein